MSSSDEPGGRQHVERVHGARRAKLTPAPGTAAEPVPADEQQEADAGDRKDSGPNDAQLRQDVPPHY